MDVGKLEGLLARIAAHRRPAPPGLASLLAKVGSSAGAVPAAPPRRASIPTPLEAALIHSSPGVETAPLELEIVVDDTSMVDAAAQVEHDAAEAARIEREAAGMRARAEREAAEVRARADHEHAEREAVESKARADREAAEAKSRADRERADREATEAKARVDREAAEAKATADRERADREAAKVKVDRERADRERADREAAEAKSRADREAAEAKAKADREAAAAATGAIAIASAAPKAGPGPIAAVRGAVSLPSFGSLVARTLSLRPRS